MVIKNIFLSRKCIVCEQLGILEKKYLYKKLNNYIIISIDFTIKIHFVFKLIRYAKTYIYKMSSNSIKS